MVSLAAWKLVSANDNPLTEKSAYAIATPLAEKLVSTIVTPLAEKRTSAITNHFFSLLFFGHWCFEWEWKKLIHINNIRASGSDSDESTIKYRD